MVEKTETYVKQFNDELDALTLKSAEVDALREKMQDANDLGVELTKESTKQRQIARKSPNYKTKQLNCRNRSLLT
jgi:hypothetical protein